MITNITPKFKKGKYAGISTDKKPLDVQNGSIYFEIDTGKYYMYDAENRIWYEQVDNGSGGGGEQVQSDWNQNDETKPDYIKNRICYDNSSEAVYIPEKDYTFDTFNGQLAANNILTELPIPNIGDFVNVIFDKVRYKCEVKLTDGRPCFGNISLLIPQEANTGEPFMGICETRGSVDLGLCVVNTGESSVHNIKATVLSYEIHKIDAKYLPEMVGKRFGNEYDSGEIFNNYTPHIADDGVEEPANIASGRYSHAEGDGTEASGEYAHAEGWRTKATARNAHAEGGQTTASERASHAEGTGTVASGVRSHAEGYYTKATQRDSHAEGWYTKATGKSSHAEGEETEASGYYSHAEGYDTTASGGDSHAEGDYTTASGENSHAEGYDTTASGYCSHAEGRGSHATSDYQHVQGYFNIDDPTGKYAHIVGNGEASVGMHSNAHTLDWEGNSWYQGSVFVGGKDMDTPDAQLNSDSVIIKSSTPGSVKRFKITVTDDGAIKATAL